MQSIARLTSLLRHSALQPSSYFRIDRMYCAVYSRRSLVSWRPCVPDLHAAAQHQHNCNVTAIQSQKRHFSGKQNVGFDVCKFGDLVVETGSACNVHVRPVNPQLCPDQNIAVVSALENVNVSCNTENGLSHLKAGVNNQEQRLECIGDCLLELPIKYNINVAVSGESNVSVDEMQNESLQITVGTGDCTLRNIQTNCLSVISNGGNIISEGIQHGDAKLQTRLSGHVRLFKPLCQQLDVSTDRGDITIESLYADESKIVTRKGNIDIGNAHRNVSINCLESGNISINSLDGSLHARVKTGNVTVYVCRHNAVDVSVQSGDITLKVPADSLSTLVDFKGNTVNIDKQLKQTRLSCTEASNYRFITGLLQQKESSTQTTTSSLRAHTSNGTINVVCQDWIGSLKLNNFLKTDDD